MEEDEYLLGTMQHSSCSAVLRNMMTHRNYKRYRKSWNCTQFKFIFIVTDKLTKLNYTQNLLALDHPIVTIVMSLCLYSTAAHWQQL